MAMIWQVNEADVAKYTRTKLMTWFNVAEAAYIITRHDVDRDTRPLIRRRLNRRNRRNQFIFRDDD